MERRQQDRVQTIQSKAHEREESMSKTMTQREWQQMVKREHKLMLREEKWQTVERIARA